MIIKKYNQFNERAEEEEEEGDNASKINADGSITYRGKKIKFSPEKGKSHIGNNEFSSVDEIISQKMIRDLARKLDAKINPDGTITYGGKKIKFSPETGKFHFNNKEFSSVNKIINYIDVYFKPTVKYKNWIDKLIDRLG